MSRVVMKARLPSTCRKCGNPVLAGDEITRSVNDTSWIHHLCPPPKPGRHFGGGGRARFRTGRP